jgi:CubicO group peptidase (beta-lactamase class C family)
MRSSLEEKVRRVLRVEFVPGSAFSYSNSGYIVLSLIVEHVTGRDYERQCKETVLVPVGATTANIGNSVQARARSGAGGWQVSTIDYAKFLTLLDPRSPTMGPPTRQWIEARDGDIPIYGLGFQAKRLADGGRVIEHNGLLTAPDGQLRPNMSCSPATGS